MSKKYFEWVSEYPSYVVLRKEGCFYTARNESAEILNTILGLKIRCVGNIKTTGSSNIYLLMESLIGNNINFLVIENNDIVEKREFADSKFLSISHTEFVCNQEKNQPTVTSYEELLKILNLLLAGIDPSTGELFEEEHVVFNYKVREIFKIAKESIDNRIMRLKNQPICAGSKWTDEEDEQLKKEYLSGMSTKEIMSIHNRTRGAITSRIIKLFPEIAQNNVSISKLEEDSEG